jgi:hypothetical protein
MNQNSSTSQNEFLASRIVGNHMHLIDHVAALTREISIWQLGVDQTIVSSHFQVQNQRKEQVRLTKLQQLLLIDRQPAL